MSILHDRRWPVIPGTPHRSKQGQEDSHQFRRARGTSFPTYFPSTRNLNLHETKLNYHLHQATQFPNCKLAKEGYSLAWSARVGNNPEVTHETETEITRSRKFQRPNREEAQFPSPATKIQKYLFPYITQGLAWDLLKGPGIWHSVVVTTWQIKAGRSTVKDGLIAGIGLGTYIGSPWGTTSWARKYLIALQVLSCVFVLLRDRPTCVRLETYYQGYMLVVELGY